MPSQKSRLLGTPFRKRLLRFFCFTLLALVLCEIFLFNGSAIATRFSKEENRSFLTQQAAFSNLVPADQPDTYRAVAANPSVTYLDIGQELTSFYWDIQPQDDKYELNYNIYYDDAAHKQRILSLKKVQVLPGVERTKYVSCQYSGKTNSLQFVLQMQQGETVKIGTLQTNPGIPIHFSVLRVLFLLGAALFLYLLFCAPVFQRQYQPGNTRHLWIMLWGLVGFCVLTVAVYYFYMSNYVLQGDQLSKELVDAFLNGKLALLEKPGNDLLNMEHPYQWLERIQAGVKYKWDHVLYQGQYYSYYGIAPVLTLFLPYHLLTGLYLPSNIACLLFSLLGSVFLTMAYLAFVKNWVKKVPVGLVFGGLLMLLTTSGVLNCVARPMFYEAAESAGLFFFTLGLYFLFISGILTGRRIRCWRLVWSACGISLAVLSRPTFAIYAAAALLFLGYGLKEYLEQQKEQKHKWKPALRYLAAALVPYAVFGGVQMAYNYLRFGSILEFGIQYSLTINDFRVTQFHTRLASVSLWNLLLGVPTFKTTFPYFFGNVETLGANGYYFFETRTTFGLLWRALPIFSILYLPRLLRRESKPARRKWLLLGVVPGLLFPLLLIAMTWESGYALRYNIDFSWQILLFALMICFTVYSRIKNEGVRRILRQVFLACTVWCIFANLALILQHVPGVTNAPVKYTEHAVWYYELVNLFSLN